MITCTAALFLLAACGGSDADDAADTSTEVSTTMVSTDDDGDGAATDTADTSDDDADTDDEDDEDGESDVEGEDEAADAVESPELEVNLPDDEPEEAGVEVLVVGDGPTVEVGDIALVAWEMVAFGTGEVVESTAADYGGPIPLQIGSGQVPSALDDALVGQTVGTRLDVQFPVGMADLPDQFDSDQAYVLTVQIVDLLDETDLSPPPETPSEQASPTTTAPAPTETGTDEPVPATGPLRATPPAGAAVPARNSYEAVVEGDGAAAGEGDTVRIEYVMVAWDSGEVVRSTDGGPQSIVLGDQQVPRFLENAIFGYGAGTRLQVIYAPDLPDLPQGLPRQDAYLVAVDIVSVG